MATTKAGTKAGATKTGATKTGAARSSSKAGARARSSRTTGAAKAGATQIGATGGNPPPVESLANNANRPFDVEDTTATPEPDNRTVDEIRAEHNRLGAILAAADSAPKQDDGKTHFHQWIPPGQ